MINISIFTVVFVAFYVILWVMDRIIKRKAVAGWKFSENIYVPNHEASCSLLIGFSRNKGRV